MKCDRIVEEGRCLLHKLFMWDLGIEVGEEPLKITALVVVT